MSGVAEFPLLPRVILFALLILMGLFTCIVCWAQIGCIRGKPFKNPDGTKDDWGEQRIFYGIAWADILFACPLTFLALSLIFLAPRWGFFFMGMVSFWFLWANLMTTITSLRFEKPKITIEWLVVFPLGAVLGLSFLAWTVVNFQLIFGP